MAGTRPRDGRLVLVIERVFVGVCDGFVRVCVCKRKRKREKEEQRRKL